MEDGSSLFLVAFSLSRLSVYFSSVIPHVTVFLDLLLGLYLTFWGEVILLNVLKSEVINQTNRERSPYSPCLPYSDLDQF